MVSVIVPVYNTACFLRECVDSILAQTVADFELILVDDGSTDGSEIICDEYSVNDNRVKVVHQKNQGMSVARNSGLDIHRGEYVTFVDADDVLYPQFIEIMLTVAAETGSDIVAAGYIRDEKAVFRNVNRSMQPVIESSIDALERLLYQKVDSAVWGKMFSSRLFDTVRFLPGMWYEDLLISIQLYPKANSVARISGRLYFYRLHPESFVCRFSEHRFDILKVTDSIEWWASKNHRDLLSAARARRFSAVYNVLLMLYKSKVNYPDVERRCIAEIMERRGEALKNPNVRLKNKIGALVSYFGVRFIKMLAR